MEKKKEIKAILKPFRDKPQMDTLMWYPLSVLECGTDG